jgi:SAM-dependent methyltransferase
MLEFKEISLADTRRLFDLRQHAPIEVGLGIKGFDYGWLVGCREWKKTERILDVGGAYSRLPLFLQKTFGCETWVADDFAAGSGETFWNRNRSPEEYIKSHPEIHFVMEYVGDESKSSLPLNHFDVVYSASVLEHAPSQYTPGIWKHMERLLKPGGELIHAIDVPFPSNAGYARLLSKYLFDVFNPLIPYSYRLKHHLATPANYLGLVCKALQLPRRIPGSLNVWKMCLDPEILTESYEHGLNRIIKDKTEGYRYQRVGSLILHLKKSL